MSREYSLEIAKNSLRESGLKVTPSRLAVHRVLFCSDHPLTHSEVAVEVKDLSSDQSTIFRNLNDLVEAGLVNKRELGDHVWRFELIRNHETHDHPHFLCEDCGQVTCIPESTFSLKKSAKFGEVTQVLLKGHCSDCQK